MPATERDTGNAYERVLIARVRAGDIEAFRELVDTYIDTMTRVAGYLTGSRDSADDIVQNVFIHVWEHRAALDPERPIKPYLLRAIRNRSSDERKSDAIRERYRTQSQAEAQAGTIPAETPSPEGAVLSHATIQAALHKLPDRRRLALQLWLADDLSDTDIAESLGTTFQAADRLIRRALADLRDILEKF